ncbi:MAG: DUF6148 family protein [Synergistaceae bacterium]|jgi:hypothetical protein|nr:DUF6148 family protein [Synergistaceae bacterium]
MSIPEARKTFYERRLALYLEAEEMILRGQSYKIGTRSLARADLAAVQGEIRRLEQILSGNGIQSRMFRVVPRDL